MTPDDALSTCAGASVEVELRRQGREHWQERPRHAPNVGPGPIHAATRRTPSHRAGESARRRRQESGRFARRHVVERRVAHEASPEQIVRCRQRELADDLRELIERCIARDLHGPARTQLAEQVPIARQEHTVLAICKLHERPVFG